MNLFNFVQVDIRHRFDDIIVHVQEGNIGEKSLREFDHVRKFIISKNQLTKVYKSIVLALKFDRNLYNFVLHLFLLLLFDEILRMKVASTIAFHTSFVIKFRQLRFLRPSKITDFKK